MLLWVLVRIRKNPQRYNLNIPGKPVSRNTHHQLEAICVKDIGLLGQSNLINLTDEGMTVSPSELGRAMAKYYIRYE